MVLKYRQIDPVHWRLDFGGHPLRDALLRAARLAFETAPLLPGDPAPLDGPPDFQQYISEEESGMPRAMKMFRAGGRNCQIYFFRMGEVWWFHGDMFAGRLESAVVPPDRQVTADPERFLADLAVYLEIDDMLDGMDEIGDSGP
jgi:hypothetical protein